MDVYTINDYINAKTNSINYYKTIIKAIENVEIVTKKDGTPFKIFSKNFKNCSIVDSTFWYDGRIKIEFKFYGWEYIYIDIKPVADDYKRPFEIKGDILKEHNLRSVYNLTFDDIKNELKYQIDMYTNYINIEQQHLDYFKKNLKVIDKYIDKLNAIIDASNIDNQFNNVTSYDYNLRSYIANSVDGRSTYDHVTLIKDF